MKCVDIFFNVTPPPRARVPLPFFPNRPLLYVSSSYPQQQNKQPAYTYLFSFLFRSYSTAQNAFLFHNWILGLIAPLAITIMSFFPSLTDVARGVSRFLMICPQYALGQGLFNLGFMEFFALVDSTTYVELDLRITGESLVYMAVFGLFFFIMLLLVER